MPLLIVNENGIQRIVRLDGRTTVGRGPDNTVVITEDRSSRLHMSIVKTGDTFVVKDENSLNGIRVNGKPVRHRTLEYGDEIRIGNASFTFTSEDSADLATREMIAAETASVPAANGAAATKIVTKPQGPDASAVRLREELEQVDPETLRKLLSVVRGLLSQSFDRAKLLTEIVDQAVALCGAARGFLLQVEPAEAKPAKVRFLVARDLDGKPLKGPSELISHSVARSVLAGGGTVLSEDAGADERFSDAQSVTNLQLRSVLCAALEVKGRIAGAIYIDSTADRGLFSQSHVGTLELFSDLAALVLHSANLIDEVRRREQDLEKANAQVRQLNQELERRYLEQTAQFEAVRDERLHLQEQLSFRYSYDNIVGRGKKMQEVFRLLDRVTDRDVNVLILGENGTGKELIARALHYNSVRRARRFESLNCAAVPEALVESELFGHMKGAFTDAHADKKGVVELANQGTLFLDEIGDMPSTMQTKLLRVLQEKSYRPVGATENRKADFRLVTATNRDLAAMVAEGRFREDLMYRVNAVAVHLPPLRERREDIPELISFFLQRESERVKEPPRKIDQETLALLVRYDWPGNIRQLENEMTRLVAISDERIKAEDLSPEIRQAATRPGDGGDPRNLPDAGLNLDGQVDLLERRLVEEALRRTSGNKSRAAKLLGLSRLGLRKKMARWGMTPSDADADDDDAAK